MTSDRIGIALDRAERALAEGDSLRGTGFWHAVGAVRRDPTLADAYADRIGTIDRRAFEVAVRLRVRAAVGLLLLAALTAMGVVLVLFATLIGYIDGFSDDVRTMGVPIAFLVGTAAMILGTHSLTHWVVGRLLGMRFTHVFLGGPRPPRPGVKVDYSTYLRTSPRARAVMHASGAVFTKIVPFALIGASVWIYADWPWVTWILIAIGVIQIVTDVLLSTKLSDWKKVLRELRAARSG